MAHFQKFKASAKSNMFKHYEREALSYSNPDIDNSRTHLNYSLNEKSCDENYNAIMNREDVFCIKRDDVNTFIDWAITLPKGIDENNQQEVRKFFEQAVEFNRERYGQEWEVGAVVHMDETTPHMHYSFIPTTWNEKKQKYSVSAKKVMTIHELKSYHNDLSKHMERVFGRDIGIKTGLTDGKNKSIDELKRNTAIQEKAIKDYDTLAPSMDSIAIDDLKTESIFGKKWDDKKIIELVDKTNKMIENVPKLEMIKESLDNSKNTIKDFNNARTISGYKKVIQDTNQLALALEQSENKLKLQQEQHTSIMSNFKQKHQQELLSVREEMKKDLMDSQEQVKELRKEKDAQEVKMNYYRNRYSELVDSYNDLEQKYNVAQRALEWVKHIPAKIIKKALEVYETKFRLNDTTRTTFEVAGNIATTLVNEDYKNTYGIDYNLEKRYLGNESLDKMILSVELENELSKNMGLHYKSKYESHERDLINDGPSLDDYDF